MEASLADDQPTLSELLTFLSERRRTCVLHVTDGQREGELCLIRGEVSFVRYGEQTGATAMLAVLTEEFLEYTLESKERISELPAIRLPASPVPAAPDAFARHELTPPAQVSATSDLRESERESEDDEETLTGFESEGLQLSTVRSYLEVVSEHEARSDSEKPEHEQTPAEHAAPEEERERTAIMAEPPSEEPSASIADAGGLPAVQPLASTPAPAYESDAAVSALLQRQLDEALPVQGGPEARDVLPAPRLLSPALALQEEAKNGETKAAGQVEPSLASWVEQTFSNMGTPPRSSRAVESLVSLLPPAPKRSSASWAWLAAALALPVLLAFLIWQPTAGSKSREAPAAIPSGPTRPASLSSAPAPVAPSGALIPTLMLRVLVKEDGTAAQVRVEGSRPALKSFEQHAVDALRSARFEPALRDGKKVQSWLNVPVRFAPAPAPEQLAVKGSDTLGASLAPAWARAFEGKSKSVRVTVEALGTATGMAALLDGSAQLATASRHIRPEELASAARLGLQLRELVAGHDGIAVIAHRDNPVQQLDVETLARIFAQRVTRWGELGGRDAAIHALGRPNYSGTHDFFRERVLAALGSETSFGSSIESVESSKQIVARVAGDRQAIAYVSLSAVDPSVQVLAVAPRRGEKAVAASVASVQDGSYPLSRPLLLYMRADASRSVRAFADFALSPEGQAIVQKSGFVPLASTAAPLLADEPDRPAAPKHIVTRIYFDPASAALAAESRQDLLVSAAAMRAASGALIIGNADATGDAEHNHALADKRARAVAAQLLRYGKDVPIDVAVASSERPRATNSTDEGRKANRRVDVIIVQR